MLTRFWPAVDDWPPVRETIVRHSGISKAEVMAALARLRLGEAPEAVLDERFVDAFAIAGTAAECLAAAARFQGAGVNELVLTFAGSRAEADMEYFGDAAAALPAYGLG